MSPVESMWQGISDALASVKAAIAVAAGGMATGLGEWLDLIPDNIGKLGVVVSIILSVVLIYAHLRKLRIELEKSDLELRILRRKEQDDYDHHINGKDRRRHG